MKIYVALCLEGQSSIPERKRILEQKRTALQEKIKEIQECLAYIDAKQQFYDAVLAGKTEYTSNLIPRDAIPGGSGPA